MGRSILIALLCLPSLVHADDEDGEEFLGLMSRAPTRDVALEHINDVRARMDGSLFCLVKNNSHPPADAQDAAFAAVKGYLESHPEERYRPRRYLILQGLRAAYPCAPR
ncbi:MAG TPA: hypothetical protein VHB46_00830 [Burkholderiales bacterium]|nr:hypothetical protein [Burkholderiales bacterium]